MAGFFPALTSVVLPIFLVAGVGVILGRTRVINEGRQLARLARATIYFVVISVLAQTLTVFIASRGRQELGSMITLDLLLLFL